MVLGDVQAVEAGGVGGRDEGEPLVELRRQGPVRRALEMVEKSDFHGIRESMREENTGA
jgi:hypothetical protein